jgi:hypothetical protein
MREIKPILTLLAILFTPVFLLMIGSAIGTPAAVTLCAGC